MLVIHHCLPPYPKIIRRLNRKPPTNDCKSYPIYEACSSSLIISSCHILRSNWYLFPYTISKNIYNDMTLGFISFQNTWLSQETIWECFSLGCWVSHCLALATPLLPLVLLGYTKVMTSNECSRWGNWGTPAQQLTTDGLMSYSQCLQTIQSVKCLITAVLVCNTAKLICFRVSGK